MSTGTVMTERRTAVIGGLLVALGPVSMALYTPAMPTLVEAFGTDVSTVKLTLTLYFTGFALAQLVCGPLSDGFGRKPVLVAFTAIYMLGSLGALFAPDVETMLAARFVQGIGAAAGVAIARAIVRDLFVGEQSARIMNMIGLMLALGPAVSPTIGGLALGLAGWWSIFLIMVIYGLAVALVVTVAVPETNAYRDTASLRPRRLAAAYRQLAVDPRFLSPSLVAGFTVGSLYTMATMLPFVLIDRAGMTPAAFGLGMMAQSGSFIIGSLAVRACLSRGIGAARLVPFGLGAIVLGAALLAVLLRIAPPHFVTVMGPVGCMAFGIAFVMPSTMTRALAPFPHIAGAAAALMGFVQMGGGLAGSLVAALMGDATLALATIIPAMALAAVLAHAGIGRLADRRDAAEAARAAAE